MRNSMHLNEYMHGALAFRLKSANREYALLNLPGEVGELLSLEAKMIRDGGDMSSHLDNVTKELGDILWCVTAIAADYGIDLQAVAEGNLKKLRARKANGTITGSGNDR
jgi:NTP pyrophosphatase (non-canonical NTP hydrolase)